MQPDTISTLLTDLLETCADAYEQTGVTVTMPARAYITHAPLAAVPWQGEQLTVQWTGFRAVAPFPLTQLRAPKAVVVPGVDFAIEVVRACWPEPHAVSGTTVQLPDPSVLTAAALALALDVAAIGAYLQLLSVKGGMFANVPGINTAQDVSVGIAVPVGPQGSLAGIRIPVSAKLAIV